MAFDISSLEAKKEAADTASSDINRQLSQSISAYSPTVQPTASDLSLHRQLLKEKAKSALAESNVARLKWYGPEKPLDDAVGTKQKSVFSKAMTLLGMPLYAQVGAVEAALGKGTQKGFLANIAANIEEKETYGDLLRKYNVPYGVAMPLGLVADVVADPFNWATAGTGAYIPRLFMGAKAGLKAGGIGKGLKIAAKSGALKDAAFASRIPGIKHLMPDNLKLVLKDQAITAAEEYDKFIGFDLAQYVSRGNIFKRGVSSASKEIDKALATFNRTYNEADIAELVAKNVKRAESGLGIPELPKVGDKYNKVEEFVSLFTPKNSEWLRDKLGQKSGITVIEEGPVAKEKVKAFVEPFGFRREPITGPLDSVDDLDNLPKTGYEGNIARARRDISETETLLNSSDRAVTHADNIDDFAGAVSGEAELDDVLKTSIGDALNGKGAGLSSAASSKISEMSDKQIVDLVEDHWKINFPNETMEAAARQKSAAIGFLKERRDALLKSDPAGIVWWDDLVSKARMNDYSRKALDGYSQYINFFKTGAIGLNPAYYPMSTVSNVVMANLAGLDISSLFPYVRDAHNFLEGSLDVSKMYKLIDNPDFQALIRNHEVLWTDFAGFSPTMLRNRKALAMYIEQTTKSGKNIKATSGAMREIYEEGLKKGVPGLKKATSEPLTVLEMRGRDLTGISSELFEKGSPWSKRIKAIGQRIEAGENVSILDRGLYKYATGSLSKAGKGFSLLPGDQSFKLGTFTKLATDGISQDELKALSNWINLSQGDYFFDASTKAYRLMPLKALEASQEIFMNYSALPAAVKMLRAMPIVGFPFISFAYLMSVKTLKGLAYNPAFFNKMQFAMNEISGGKTPLEKRGLQNPYYSWFTDDGMMKIPFFKDNPVYMNLANMLPYYTLNIFQDPERFREMKEQTLGSSAIRLIDRLPFFKDPIGSLLLDYFIVPSIIRNAKGQFNQPIYPVSSTPWQKAGYVLRAAAETITPPAAALAGPLVGMVAPGAADYLPKYRMRALSRAIEGKSPQGVLSKENPVTKTIRNLAGTFGLPFYTMDLTYNK